MRKLASVRRVSEIQPIPGADAIVCATVDGWKVVVKKDEFIPGDLAVYFEVDSWIPNLIAPFLSKGKEPKEFNGIKGERLRTVKLRGQLSQGLLVHLGAIDIPWKNEYKEDGYDLTEVLGIQKYEPPVSAQLAGIVRGAWPSWIPKTDEERIQNLVNEWNDISNDCYEVTEKLEGSSMTVAMIEDEFIVCSRNLNLEESATNSFWEQAHRYNIKQKLIDAQISNIAIQGELVGEGVQGNHYDLKGRDFYVFAMYNIETGSYVSPSERRYLCELFGLKHVPVINEAYYITGAFDNNRTVEDVLTSADGYSMINASKLREGLVFKSLSNDTNHWKAVSNEYLLKHG